MGLPTAITSAVWTQFKADGFAWHSLWSVTSLIRLAIGVCVTGILGGLAFSALMRRAGFDPEQRR